MLKLQNIAYQIGNFTLKQINLEVADNDYFVLLGPSGAGKSVLLEIIAGIIFPDSGKMIMNGKDITYLKTQQRSIGIVFQKNAVFPHLTVNENIAYALKLKKLNKSEIQFKTQKLALDFRIINLLDRLPAHLSGGELQRVLLARTLAMQPDIILFDEPFSSLDIQLRDDFRLLLRKVHESGVTIIHVTHDFTEAFSLAQKIAIIDNGRVIQCDTPEEIRNKPKSRFVALSSGIYNYFQIEQEGNAIKVDHHFLIENLNANNCNTIIIPDDALTIYKNKPEKLNIFKGKVIDYMVNNHDTIYIIDIGINIYKKDSNLKLIIGQSLYLYVEFDKVIYIN